MIPAAPLVGAVTTRPPEAFSSLTASAYRVTQSIGAQVVMGGVTVVEGAAQVQPRAVAP